MNLDEYRHDAAHRRLMKAKQRDRALVLKWTAVASETQDDRRARFGDRDVATTEAFGNLGTVDESGQWARHPATCGCTQCYWQMNASAPGGVVQ
jgi:hypothetical protein